MHASDLFELLCFVVGCLIGNTLFCTIKLAVRRHRLRPMPGASEYIHKPAEEWRAYMRGWSDGHKWGLGRR